METPDLHALHAFFVNEFKQAAGIVYAGPQGADGGKRMVAGGWSTEREREFQRLVSQIIQSLSQIPELRSQRAKLTEMGNMWMARKVPKDFTMLARQAYKGKQLDDIKKLVTYLKTEGVKFTQRRRDLRKGPTDKMTKACDWLAFFSPILNILGNMLKWAESKYSSIFLLVGLVTVFLNVLSLAVPESGLSERFSSALPDYFPKNPLRCDVVTNKTVTRQRKLRGSSNRQDTILVIEPGSIPTCSLRAVVKNYMHWVNGLNGTDLEKEARITEKDIITAIENGWNSPVVQYTGIPIVTALADSVGNAMTFNDPEFTKIRTVLNTSSPFAIDLTNNTAIDAVAKAANAVGSLGSVVIGKAAMILDESLNSFGINEWTLPILTTMSRYNLFENTHTVFSNIAFLSRLKEVTQNSTFPDVNLFNPDDVQKIPQYLIDVLSKVRDKKTKDIGVAKNLYLGIAGTSAALYYYSTPLGIPTFATKVLLAISAGSTWGAVDTTVEFIESAVAGKIHRWFLELLPGRIGIWLRHVTFTYIVIYFLQEVRNRLHTKDGKKVLLTSEIWLKIVQSIQCRVSMLWVLLVSGADAVVLAALSQLMGTSGFTKSLIAMGFTLSAYTYSLDNGEKIPGQVITPHGTEIVDFDPTGRSTGAQSETRLVPSGKRTSTSGQKSPFKIASGVVKGGVKKVQALLVGAYLKVCGDLGDVLKQPSISDLENGKKLKIIKDGKEIIVKGVDKEGMVIFQIPGGNAQKYKLPLSQVESTRIVNWGLFLDGLEGIIGLAGDVVGLKKTEPEQRSRNTTKSQARFSQATEPALRF